MTTPQDVSRLPRWAQDRIALLEGTVADLRAQAARLTGPEPTNVGLMDLDAKGMPCQRNLPDNAHIVFALGKSRPQATEDMIEVSHTRTTSPDAVVEIRARDGYLVVRPASGNAIYVGVRRHT